VAEKNEYGLPNGAPIASAWSRVIRNQKVALRKLLDNSRFANATIITSGIDEAMRVWRGDLDAYTDELTGRMIPYMTSIITRSGNAIRTRQGYRKADDWFIRDPGRVLALESTVLDLCQDTLDVIAGEAGEKVAQLRRELIAGEIDDGAGGWKDLYSSLDEYFESSSKWRSARIARTEASRAANWGIRAAAEELDELVGFEWLMAPGACAACLKAGKTADGKARRVRSKEPFVRNYGPKVTNEGDPERERTIPEEYRQIGFAPLHPNCRCSVKPIFAPLDGSQVRMDDPIDANGESFSGAAEIGPVDLTGPGGGDENPDRSESRSRITL
jgi:hypothetical protein